MANRALNIGCGRRYAPDWVNVDVAPAEPGVLACDVRKGLPFRDSDFDFVYLSHVLEHMRPLEAKALIKECLRVLRPEGAIRVVVPDLEQMARSYLKAIDACGDAETPDHEWMLIEMVDQLSRETPGGRMLQHLRSPALTNHEFIVKRIGAEAKGIWQAQVGKPAGRVWSFKDALAKMAGAVGRRAVALFLGTDWHRQYLVGKFRDGGEPHKWAYDRLSLAALLKECGFVRPQLHSHCTSRFAGWQDARLDTAQDGTSQKPDSMYMEATRPG